jgi:hypothetical protein
MPIIIIDLERDVRPDHFRGMYLPLVDKLHPIIVFGSGDVTEMAVARSRSSRICGRRVQLEIFSGSQGNRQFGSKSHRWLLGK